ncbi:glutathione S-transferase family protein [Sphingobium nicotianae]|uniref:Glutathione S-transferase family protein n=1 Tax=Sphingobium nicotianae TaxID=2782607 RepID=A0A9X1DAV9_9SPHN|nr:glutathione S-transferase family protein [Sphingobium nicotianae]MBT2186608.1 glutathione S-transferase family protein [Sphingobium nicotianae]
MPQRDDAAIEVTGFAWVPPFARGHVRDLRVRWALEEIGLDYRTRLISAVERPTSYFGEQPYGQVPYYKEGDVEIFESGAIVLHIAEKDERLLPRDPVGRVRAQTWLISALNSMEPYIMNMVTIDGFCADQEWALLRRPAQVEMMERRLQHLSVALGDKDWLEGRFTVGDLMMVEALRNLSADRLSIPQNLQDYVARGEARPAFQAALAAQLADFVPDEEGVPA